MFMSSASARFSADSELVAGDLFIEGKDKRDLWVVNRSISCERAQEFLPEASYSVVRVSSRAAAHGRG